jgi:glycosyltransferase involved in cell wall biosynthesis
MGNDKITVIIPIYNSIKHLKTCLDSVCAAIDRYGNAELILVDNGSTDGSYELAREDYGRKAKVHQIEDVTIAALRNHGARLAQGEYLSFIDSDCVIPKHYFHSAMAVFTSREADAAGCYYSLPETPCWIEETWENLNQHPVNTYVPYLFSSNLLIKKAVFERVAGFNERLITGEDAELGLRLNTSGFKIFASPEISAVHLRNPKTLGQFFRKQTWHGLGMFGTFRYPFLDKPVLMTFAHVLLTAMGVVSLTVSHAAVLPRIAVSLCLFLAVPVVAVMYRSAKRGSLYRPLRSTLLYYLYFTARVYALFKIIWRRLRGS